MRPAGPSRFRRLLRAIGTAVLYLVAMFLVVRAAAEPFLIDPTRPENFRADWGGPTYAGVLLVHIGPGLFVLVLLVLHLRRGRRARTTQEHGAERVSR